MKKLVLAGMVVASVLLGNAGASDSCTILANGNKYFHIDNAKAIEAYKSVEQIDRYGEQTCTSSVYATIATLYKTLGDESTSNESKISYYRQSALYNRAFAYATACKYKDCQGSKRFWDEENKFWQYQK